ncbi:MAG TPA: hypothetical protein VHP12_01495 [Chitinophagaceae bacterium]|nr:hypothetical protein [Chitinophagaceae bacterium]
MPYCILQKSAVNINFRNGISYENKNPCDVVTNVPLKNKNKVALILKDNAGVIKNITLEKE